MKNKLILSLFLFCSACVSSVSHRPISYPWLCEEDPHATECHFIGHEISSDDPVMVQKYADYLCVDHVRSITFDRAHHHALVTCDR